MELYSSSINQSFVSHVPFCDDSMMTLHKWENSFTIQGDLVIVQKQKSLNDSFIWG